MNRRKTVLPSEQRCITLSQALLYNCVKYTRIVLKLIVFYRYLLEILFELSVHSFALEGLSNIILQVYDALREKLSDTYFVTPTL